MKKTLFEGGKLDTALVLFAVISCLGVTLYMAREIFYQLTWKEAEGMVLEVRTELEASDDGPDYYVYYATVRYYADGERYVSVLFNGVRRTSAGDTVSFLCNPKKPTETVMKNKLWWFGFAVSAFMSAIFIRLLKPVRSRAL